MIVYRGITVGNDYVTQGTYARLPPSHKLTFVTSADLYCQVLTGSVDTFPPSTSNEFTVPQGYLSKTFYDPIFGLRFRTTLPGSVATVEFTLI